MKSRENDNAISLEIACGYRLLVRLAVYYGPNESGVIYIQFNALRRNDDMSRCCCAALNLGIADHTREQTTLRIGATHLGIDLRHIGECQPGLTRKHVGSHIHILGSNDA